MISTTIFVTSMGLFIASLIEFFICFLILRKDRTYKANQLLSIAFLFIGLTIFINLIFFSFPLSNTEVLTLSRLSNTCAIIFGIFLFATVVFIRFGNTGFKNSVFLTIVFISLLCILGVLFYNGMGIILYNDLPIITWNSSYLVIASIPIILLGSASVYYFIKLHNEIKDDKSIRTQIKLSILAYSLIVLAFFLSRMPFYLIELNKNLESLYLPLSITASIFVVFFSIFIAWIFLQKKVPVPAP